MLTLFKKFKRRSERELWGFFSEINGFILEKILRFRAATSCESGVFENGKRPGLTVSLTSVPERLPKIFIVIESLLRQTQKPDRIILWLDKKIGPADIPETLRKQTKRGLTIRSCEDLGPHTKLHYALKEYAEDILVNCDDDRIYPSSWLEGLYKTHQKNPAEIICYRAHEISLDEKKNIKKYLDWKMCWLDDSWKVLGPSHFLFATGTGGVLYPPGSLDTRVLDKEIFQKICPTNDDVWLKAMAMLKNTRYRKVKARFTEGEFPTIRNSQKRSLFKTNFKGLNDRQIKDVFSYYHLENFFSASCL